MKTKKTQRKPKRFDPPVVIETFKRPGYHDIRQYVDSPFDAPWCHNDSVGVRRYRITIELIEETEEVLAERVLSLWRGAANFRQVEPLRAEAAKYGLVLRQEEFAKPSLNKKINDDET